jgi:hypothetical protein
VRPKACGEEEHQFLLLFRWQRVSRSFDFSKLAHTRRLELIVGVHDRRSLDHVHDYDNVAERG